MAFSILDALMIDDIEDNALNTQTNSNISNHITHEAISTYYKTFKDKWVPLSFIEFYFEEYKRYTFMSPEFLKPYYDVYNAKDLKAIVENYYTSDYSLIRERSQKKGEPHYLIEPNFLIDVRLCDRDVLGRFSPELYSNLLEVSRHILSGDELLTTEEIYENFMMKKMILEGTLPTPTSTHTTAQSKPSVEKVETPTVENKTLIGSASETQQQKGRVVKLTIPKLTLPSPYPIQQDNKSRINSEHRAKHFATTDKQIKVINKHQFNRVKYKVSFIEKRKVAQKPQKRKFEFDF